MTALSMGPHGWVGKVVREDPLTMSLHVLVARPSGDSVTHLIALSNDGATLHQMVADPSAATPPDVELRIPDDIARTLYEALGQWYSSAGPPDAQEVREALHVERARVDLVLSSLVDAVCR